MPFVDLRMQRERLGDRMDAAIRRVLEHGQFVMGPEVFELENRLAAYCGAAHTISCSSGTDALLLALLAIGVREGDGVIVPSFGYVASAEAVARVGAVPVFADVLPDTFNLDPCSLLAAIDTTRAGDVQARAVIAVDLFGQPADYDAIEQICAEERIALVADAAQSFGASWRDRPTGSIGLVACTSFYPSKPLGAYGDGGALFTNDDDLADRLRSLRVHGHDPARHEHVRIGINSRLDTIQAAVLLQKLDTLNDELEARREVANRYASALRDSVEVPAVRTEATSAWAQYAIRLDTRDDVAKALRAEGIPTAVHYRTPLHAQHAYKSYPAVRTGLPVSEHLAARVLSLPMHPYLDHIAQDRVITAVAGASPT
jgi:dTDP-4-amino-4,6-dideoxygalactose transaminase